MDSLFGLVTIAPLVVWGAMLLFPRSRFTQRLVLSYWPYVVGSALYLVVVVALVGTQAADLGLSAASLQTLWSSSLGALVVWVHIQVANLFFGVWMFRDAKYWGVNPGLYLLATVLAGPVGLGAYCLMRIRRSGNDPARVVN